MGIIDRKEQEDFSDLIMHIVKKDEKNAADSILNLTYYKREPDRIAFEEDISEIISQYIDRPLKEIEIQKLFHKFLDLNRRYGISLKPHHFTMLTSLSSIEGLGRELDPDFEIINIAKPFIRQIRFNRYDPKKTIDEFSDTLIESINLLKELPGEIRAILKQAKSGEMKIEFFHRGLDPMLITHDQISNRLAFAIILASLIIGSSLIVVSDIPPKWNEIPVIGLGGFVIAGMIGFWLLGSILKHRRM
jgi:ubiquinone biosynthesis protein